MNPISTLARLYFSHFPVEKGKWRLWERFRDTKYYHMFPPASHRTRYGFWMNIEPSQQIDRFIYYWGCWEPNETRLIRKLLRPKDVFVDVGANDGYFSLLASKLVGRLGQVVALEPFPTTAIELRANVALNRFRNIAVIERAASDNSDDLVLTMPHEVGTGMTTLRPVDGTSWCVKCDRLDNLLADLPAPRFVKIDVEGAELRVLRGMEKLLQRDSGPYVLCEVTASYLKQVGDSAGELYALMDHFGYRAYLVKGHELQVLRKGALRENDQDSVLFTKRDQPGIRDKA